MPKTKTKEQSDWIPPRIEDELRNIMVNSPKLGERHYPIKLPDGEIPSGKQCLFINKAKDLGQDHGVIFEVCAYIKGHIPEAAMPDLESGEAVIKPAPIIDEEGNPKELVYTYRCIAFGQVLIVETLQGAGGIGYLQRLLRALVKKYRPKGHGAIKLQDLVSDDLRALIKSRGGVRSMRASMLHEVAADGSKYSEKLGDLHKAVKGTNRCVVEWVASDNGELDLDEALEAVDEVGDLGLDGVSIAFNDGGGFSELSQYKECKPVRIQLTPDGRPAVTEIELELRKYLLALRDPKNSGPVKTDGTLKKVTTLGS